MPKQKTIAELNAEKEKIEQQLTQEQHKKQRLENRIAYYERGDRTKRAHNLIVRSADMESIAPLAKLLTRAEFYAFAEKVFDLPESRACSWKRSTNTTGLNRKRGAEYRVIPFSCDTNQAQCGTVRCGVCRLPCRGKAAQRILRRDQRLHPKRRRDLL